ncbi:MAG: hypothetical protein JSW40_02410, partial [Candidatus Omnitrophota bacterium]
RIKMPKIDFACVPSLSREVIEKLDRLKPLTLGDALRISGITPAAVLNIYNFIKKGKYSSKSSHQKVGPQGAP